MSLDKVTVVKLKKLSSITCFYFTSSFIAVVHLNTDTCKNFKNK